MAESERNYAVPSNSVARTLRKRSADKDTPCVLEDEEVSQ